MIIPRIRKKTPHVLTHKPQSPNSPEQQEIIDWVQSTQSGHLIIEAVAGSGKTSTLLRLLPLLKGRVLLLAFNNSAVATLKEKVSQHYPDIDPNIQTFHSLGYSIIRDHKNSGRIQGDDSLTHLNELPNYMKKKTNIAWKIIKEQDMFPDSPWQRSRYARLLVRLASLCQNTLINYNDLSELERLCSKFDVKIPENMIDGICTDIEALLDRSKDLKKLDFDDMIYFPAVNDELQCQESYDWILVDELQDVNLTQITLVEKVCRQNTRVIGVGDRNQAIYGFRGAEPDAIDKFKRMLEKSDTVTVIY